MSNKRKETNLSPQVIRDLAGAVITRHSTPWIELASTIAAELFTKLLRWKEQVLRG